MDNWEQLKENLIIAVNNLGKLALKLEKERNALYKALENLLKAKENTEL